MVAGRTNRRSLRIVALVAAAGPAVALVTACSATGGTAAPGPPRGRTLSRPGARRRPRRGRPAGRRRADCRHAAPAVPGALRLVRLLDWAPRRPARLARPRLPAPRPPPPQPGAPARAAAAAGAHLVTFVNRVSQTVWVAPRRTRRTRWPGPAGASARAQPDDHRPEALERPASGAGPAASSGLAGATASPATAAAGYQCTGNGAIPATLAEYDMNAWDGLDFYDVSMVDGSNLPMFINVTHGTAANRVSRKGCVRGGLHHAGELPQRAAGEGGRRGGRLRVRVRTVRHRPVLLPRRLGLAVGVQPGPVAGGLRRRVQEGRAVRLLVRRRRRDEHVRLQGPV